MDFKRHHLVYAFVALFAAGGFLLSSRPMAAQQQASTAAAGAPDPALLAHYHWRNIGPDRGGRSIAVSGVVGQPKVAYFGAVGGGLWKTLDGGDTWQPMTDFQIGSASVGAVAVSESDPSVVYIGTGEACIRNNILPGDGVYRSSDAGKTWKHVGFDHSDAISKIQIDPKNPNIVFVASFGKYSVPSDERGVYKSTDGGNTWRRVLFRDDHTGAIELVIDRNNPQVIYAALWQAFRNEYTMSSGGPGSGLFKSTDGGETWKEITRNPGLPQGVVGKIGIAISSADSNRVYALIENEHGGLYRSDDAGATWKLANDDHAIRQRAFYYTHVFADEQNADVVYIENTSLFRSTDAGKTLKRLTGTHGDFHDLWIDPKDPAHLVVGNDGGGAVSFDTGKHWTAEDYPTGQFYHAATTTDIPYHVCGAQQDNSTLCVDSSYNRSRFESAMKEEEAVKSGEKKKAEPREIGWLTQGSMDVSYEVGGGEPGYVAPDPKNVGLFFSGANNGSYIDRFDRVHGTSREVSPYPWFYSGEPSSSMVERWQWTFPILFSPVDPDTLYTSSQRLWVTKDGGVTWKALSGDLTRADPKTLGVSGGPITHDMNGPEVYAVIFSIGPGKADPNVIWTGSDDGVVSVTKDGGTTWTKVTPPGMPDFGRVSQIDASAFDAGRAYVSVRRPLLNDFAPYIFKTSDFGQTWTKITNGIPNGAYVNAVREDPHRRGLLYAATNQGVYISYDDGGDWLGLNGGLPKVPVADLVVKDDSLAIATHGRGFWILDDIQPLRQATPATTQTDLVLFNPAPTYREGGDAAITWWSAKAPTRATLEILDGSGTVLRTYETAPKAEKKSTDQGKEEPREADEGRSRYVQAPLSARAGLNELDWDLRTQPWASFPGMIFWGVRVTAPAVPPGTYTLRLTADGKTATSKIEVRANPWISATQADMEAQYAFGRQVWEKVNEANTAVIEIRRVKAQLDKRLASSKDARLQAAAKTLIDHASEVEAQIYQVKNRSGQDPLNFPIRVNNRLANLLSMSEHGVGRPNQGMRDVFQIMTKNLKEHTDRLAQIWSTDLAAVNRELTRVGLEPLDPHDAGTKLTAPSGR
jgi:photosystem II stability/assembly factor-like uncharacterized protein